MPLNALPREWMPTRASLQAYAHALTAFPRAAAPYDLRWSHVAMDPTATGFASASTPLSDGAVLDSEVDLIGHVIVVSAGEDRLVFDLSEGPSPRQVGDAIVALIQKHGSAIDVDEDRFSEESTQSYNSAAASAFFDASSVFIAAVRRVNGALEGEIAGPHLWPHGFDIATEWFSPRTVVYEGNPTSAQIAMGWYPTDEAYVYVNPWPFKDGFADVELPAGAVWHRDSWEGAKLDIPEGASISPDDVIAVGAAVHSGTRGSLGA
ncbi:MAG: DUF5996 family protein [Acidimicrobiia bacterium]